MLLFSVWTMMAAGAQDCARVVETDSFSRQAQRCLLDQPELLPRRGPPADVLFVGDGSTDELRDEIHQYRLPDGRQLQVQVDRSDGSSLAGRALVAIEWADPVILRIDGGHWTHHPELAFTDRLMVTIDLSDEGSLSKRVAVWDHRSGDRVRTISIGRRVEGLSLHNGWLIVRTRQGQEVWSLDGTHQWTARTVMQGGVQVSPDGRALVLSNARTTLFRPDAEPVTLPNHVSIVGDRVFAAKANGTLWQAPVGDVERVPKADVPGRFMVAVGGQAAWLGGRLVPEGASVRRVPGRRTAFAPGALPDTQTVTLSTDRPATLGLFRVARPRLTVVEEEGLSELDQLVRKVLTSEQVLIERIELSPSAPTVRELPSDQSFAVTAGDDGGTRIAAMPGAVEHGLKPRDTETYTHPLFGKEHAVRVVDADGTPVPGALVTSRGPYRVADANGVFRWRSLDGTEREYAAISDTGWATWQTTSTLTLNHPPQQCRVLSSDGTELHPYHPCERIALADLFGETSTRATLRREAPDRVSLVVRRSVWLPSHPRLDKLDRSSVTDSEGGTHETPQYLVPDLPSGPAMWRVELDGRAWCQRFEVLEGTTEVRDAWERCD